VNHAPRKAVKTLSILGAVVTFAWGVYQHVESGKKQAETRRIEATKPFLDRQLKLYTEATQSAATLATTEDPSERSAAMKRFWSLYWGELALVEDRGVEAAMVMLGKGLERGAPQQELKQLSLKLAHAARESLAGSWGVKEWQNPHRVVADQR
jgi:hypothetical protein